MAYFIQIAFAGIALGCIYALIGLGFTIIFKASEVINFAQGELLLVGAYVVSSGVYNWHLNFILAVALGVVVTVVIGLVFERFVLRRMIGRPVFSILMITIGLDTILFIDRRQASTQLDDVAVAVIPFVKQCKIIDDLVDGHGAFLTVS